ncbi:MAG: hypothetical protein JSV03_01795 [Planctomycetota bacterium]|nr:MAG: hypothetical protein JSV03_01795 [Planctomycetota bacterium]
MPNQLPSLETTNRKLITYTLLIICSTISITGCGLARALTVQAAPTTERVPPEYNRLPGKRALVYVWAPPETRFDYPKMCLDLSAYVSAYLKQHVEDIDIVNPIRIEDYNEKKGAFETDPVELGRHFRTDMVIHLSIYHFSMRDPGYAQFYRGRISSSVAVYELTGNEESAEHVPLQDVVVSVPEKNPVGFHNVDPAQIRQATYDTFAVEVGKKFHEYERPLD